jgi:hypothetical protein
MWFLFQKIGKNGPTERPCDTKTSLILLFVRAPQSRINAYFSRVDMVYFDPAGTQKMVRHGLTIFQKIL